MGPEPRRHFPKPNPLRLDLLPGASIHLHIRPTNQTLPFNIKQRPYLIPHPSPKLHAHEHLPVIPHRGVGRAIRYRSAVAWDSCGAPLARGLAAALVEGLQGRVRERPRGGIIEEDREGEKDSTIFDGFVLVVVLEGEVEEEGVVFVVGGGEGREVEGLEGAFGGRGAEGEPEEGRGEAKGEEGAETAPAAVGVAFLCHACMHARDW